MGGPDRTCLIEVGCGTGEALLPLRNKFKHIVGIDFNENFIEFCNSKLDEPIYKIKAAPKLSAKIERASA